MYHIICKNINKASTSRHETNNVFISDSEEEIDEQQQQEKNKYEDCFSCCAENAKNIIDDDGIEKDNELNEFFEENSLGYSLYHLINKHHHELHTFIPMLNNLRQPISLKFDYKHLLSLQIMTKKKNLSDSIHENCSNFYNIVILLFNLLKYDINTMKKILKRDGMFLKYFSDDIRLSEELCLIAVKTNVNSIKYVEIVSDTFAFAIKQNFLVFKQINNPTEGICWVALTQSLKLIQYIASPTEAMIRFVLKNDASMIKFIKKITPEMCQLCVDANSNNIQYIEEIKNSLDPDVYDELCWNALDNDSDVIKYINEPTEGMLWHSLIKNIHIVNSKVMRHMNEDMYWYVIDEQISLYVYLDPKKLTVDMQWCILYENPGRISQLFMPTDKMQWYSIKKNTTLISFVKEPTEEMQWYVLKENPSNIMSRSCIKTPTKEMFWYAFNHDAFTKTYIPKEMCNDLQFSILFIMKYKSAHNFERLTTQLKNNRDLVIKLLLNGIDIFCYLEPEIKNSDDIAILGIKLNANNYKQLAIENRLKIHIIELALDERIGLENVEKYVLSDKKFVLKYFTKLTKYIDNIYTFIDDECGVDLYANLPYDILSSLVRVRDYHFDNDDDALNDTDDVQNKFKIIEKKISIYISYLEQFNTTCLSNELKKDRDIALLINDVIAKNYFMKTVIQKTKPLCKPFTTEIQQYGYVLTHEEYNRKNMDMCIKDCINIYRFKHDDCPICCEKMMGDDGAMPHITKCKHAFHVKCIHKWLIISLECPMCRCKLERQETAHQEIIEADEADADYNSNDHTQHIDMFNGSSGDY